MRPWPPLPFWLAVAVGAVTSLHAVDTLDFTGRLGAISPANKLQEEGYYVWGASAIRGEDDKYYLFYSRWKAGTHGRAPEDRQVFKDMAGWLKYCEIAAAVSDSPAGPFKHSATVLRGTGDTNRWDCFNAHNPHIKRFRGKVYLYFIANQRVAHTNRWIQMVDGQRIGVAVASSVKDLIEGRFQRSAQPLITPDGTNTYCRVVNPSVTEGRDGRYLMMFKSRSARTGGHMVHWVAIADHPDGPFNPAGPALLSTQHSAEDPYFWYDRERDCYYAIVKDFSSTTRALTPQFGALGLIVSDRGWGDWRVAAHPLVSLREYTGTTGTRHTLAHLERPQLLFDDRGNPSVLYCAAAEKDPFRGTPSFNLHFPIQLAPPSQMEESAEVSKGRSP